MPAETTMLPQSSSPIETLSSVILEESSIVSRRETPQTNQRSRFGPHVIVTERGGRRAVGVFSSLDIAKAVAST
jgi:hypothetical protein